jgi:AcrR family transcriptional regulator
MNVKTEDRRVRKTKKALREGLAELMMEKELRNITVRELVDKVDIHRATFYANYKDIYDLYEQIEDTIVKEIETIFASESLHNYETFFKTLINYVYDNTKICRVFLDKNGNKSFLYRITAILEEKYLEVWAEDMKQDNIPEEWRYYTNYHICGCLSTVRRWAENGFEYPKEELIAIITKIDAAFDELTLK